jgi:hypothetical protein
VTILRVCIPALVLIAGLVAPPTAMAAPTPAEKCLTTKLKLMGKYDACLLKAYTLFVLKDLPAPDFTKCSTSFLDKWADAETKYGAECMTSGDGGSMDTFARDHAADVYTLLTGGSLLCGNGAIDAGEDCDGANLGTATCGTEGFGGGGTLSCETDCTFDTSECLSCVPGDCAEAGAECGEAGDGCGGTQSCGTCPLPSHCGLGGTPSDCGGNCSPTTCGLLGAACGEQTDGCGGTLSCGPCPPGQFCMGTPSVCVATPDCTPLTPAAACGSRVCGQAKDGCGELVECGTCPDGQGCRFSDGTCQTTGVCVPRTCNSLATAAGTTPCGGTATSGCYCGFVADGCGDVIDCGGCLASEECGAADPNVCQ